jgi:hypothetical protein
MQKCGGTGWTVNTITLSAYNLVADAYNAELMVDIIERESVFPFGHGLPHCFLSAPGLERHLVFTGTDWCEEESSGGFGFR